MRGLRPSQFALRWFGQAKSKSSMAFAGLLVSLATSACAGPTWGYPDAPGRLVGVRVDVSGSPTPLYPDPRGTGRYYLEARQGQGYEIHLSNRTGQRLGAVVTVDGLNVVSGERDARRGRMYVLDPWGSTTIRGWRRSLHDVHRFTFVDEKGSYASLTGKANGRMGWIEVSVYRESGRAPCCDERGARVSPYSPKREPDAGHDSEPDAWARADEARDRAESAPPRDRAEVAPPAAPEAQPEAKSADELEEDSARGTLSAPGMPALRPRRSFPGTGWGSRVDDPVMVVSFEPEEEPAERLTFRYEYAAALRALGIRPWPEMGRDRLRERERGEWGFAQPPAR
jgi:hypothetical protein